MELPDDVLSIIRAYSKPSFVWFKEYTEARSLNLCTDHFQKLREKMDDPIVRKQLKICVDARADHKKAHDAFLCRGSDLNEERESKKDWWLCVSMEELYALLDDSEHRAMNYEEWYFKDNAWMDSDEDTVES
jgi:hypothetical protein